MSKIKSITVIGRRWFQNLYGNTYCTAEIFINGEPITKLPMEYGYGDFYIQAAGEYLKKHGYTNQVKNSNTGSLEPLWRYCSDNNIDLVTSVTDVKRKKDL